MIDITLLYLELFDYMQIKLNVEYLKPLNYIQNRIIGIT